MLAGVSPSGVAVPCDIDDWKFLHHAPSRICNFERWLKFGFKFGSMAEEKKVPQYSKRLHPPYQSLLSPAIYEPFAFPPTYGARSVRFQKFSAA
jgi:hypothetical protein